jgi:hypothetical protein
VSKYSYSYLGLAPVHELNGPSFVTALNSTDRMLNLSVSYQLVDWAAYSDNVGDNNITFGGNVESAFRGLLKWNLILGESPWTFAINY